MQVLLMPNADMGLLWWAVCLCTRVQLGGLLLWLCPCAPQLA